MKNISLLSANLVMALVVLLLSLPSAAFALPHSMTFGAGDFEFFYNRSYVEDAFRVTPVNSGKRWTNNFELLTGPSDRNLQIHLYNNAGEIIIDHFDLAFDLMSLDIEYIYGGATITSSTGSSRALNALGTNLFEFDSLWQNITSFTIVTDGYLRIDNFEFENPATVSPVPEPGTLFLLGAGLIGLAGYRGLRRRKQG